MKTSSKLLIIIAIGVVLIGVCSFPIWRERNICHNQELVKLAYTYWEIEQKEGETTRVFWPQLVCKDPNFFESRRFYFCLKDLRETGTYIDLLVESEEGSVFRRFRVGYYIFKPPSDIVRYEWSDFDLNYFSASHGRLKAEKERDIGEKSEKLLKLAGEKFKEGLACYQLRKEREQEFRQGSLELGPKLARVEKLLDSCLSSLRMSTRISRGYHFFEIPSKRFESVICRFFYDPNPDFKLTRIELGEFPAQKYFDVGYDYVEDHKGIWGFIDNNVELESFGVLGEALDLVEKEIVKDPNIVVRAVLGNL